MAIVMTVHRLGSLANGHVNSRHTSPSRTADGKRRVDARTAGSTPTNMPATEPSTTSIVVLTSSVPIRNHGSLALRRPGTENEKRPAMAHNRILEH